MHPTEVVMGVQQRSCGRSVVARYLEELETLPTSVVSQKAAYFEQVIRSVSSNTSTSDSRKSSTSTVTKPSGNGITTQVSELEGFTNTARTLVFSSSSSSDDSDEATDPSVSTESCGSPPAESDCGTSSGSDQPADKLLREECGGNDACQDGACSTKLVLLPSHHVQVLKEKQDPHPEDKDTKNTARDTNSPFAKGQQASKSGKQPSVLRKAVSKVAFLSTFSQVPTPSNARGPDRRNSAAGGPKSGNFTRPQPFKLSTDKGDKTKLRSQAMVKQLPKKPDKKCSVADKQEEIRSISASAGCATKQFSLKTDERAEKRKQFHSKLEEKMVAKEQEKKVKTQGELEGKVRRLRQGLNFKAKPMPSFYSEATKSVEHKKKQAPTTRPVSPKLGRQNGHRQTPAPLNNNKATAARHSSSQKHTPANNGAAAPTWASPNVFPKEENEQNLHHRSAEGEPF